MSTESCGIIPLSKQNGLWKVFLIAHLGYEEYWSCPKGHLSPNETPQQAARRELQEETGLTVKQFLSQEPIIEEFYWYYKGQRLLKRVLYFIAEVEGTINLQKEEIAHGEWFSLPSAIEKVKHPEGKATLRQVEDALK